MPATSVFAIAEIGVPPYSERGITEQLVPIQGDEPWRDINGTLRDNSASQFRKYQLTVTCTDYDSPALSGVWKGMQVTVDCLTELAFRDATDAEPDRTPVPGSLRTGELSSADGGGPDGFKYYRPRLTMRVMSYSIGTADGWGDAKVNWQLVLQEI